jgi:hypothetical protein
MLMVCELPPATDPLPERFCRVEGGRTEISVSSLNVSPNAATATEMLATLMVFVAAI